MAKSNILIYLLRRDLRVSDNPIFHHLASIKDHGFSHLLPIYIFPYHQIEISGFLTEGKSSPYPPAVSEVGKFWRCGPHRAKFVAQAVWDVKKSLEELDSGLLVRVGSVGDVLEHVVSGLQQQKLNVGAVWMTEEKTYEEIVEQDTAASVCSGAGIKFMLWPDEKYFVDDRDNGLRTPNALPDVFTNYRKSQEPLRDRPRRAVPRPEPLSLPPFPDRASIPSQHGPFTEAKSLEDLEQRLLKPVASILDNPPPFPDGAKSVHPFQGGETHALDRLRHLIISGAMGAYKETRNGLLGADFSTKLSAYLALGCISARTVHGEMLKYENGSDRTYEAAPGFGEGENDGTRGVRFEFLWRDYMRLCAWKFGRKLFKLEGFRQNPSYNKRWITSRKDPAVPSQNVQPDKVSSILDRFWAGTTGMGFIDASQRELFHTGYTSNRARQNVASFLTKHLDIDWRFGAEWYEMLLVDYDVSSNWSNWQYVAGVGNDPRGDARIFNPVKQAFDYDKEGEYVRTWVPELRDLDRLENVFQPCTTDSSDLERCALTDHIMVTQPLKRIQFSLDKKPRPPRKSANKKGGHRGNRRGGRHGASQGRQTEQDSRPAEPTRGHGGGNGAPPTWPNRQQNGQAGQGQTRHYSNRNGISGGSYGGPMNSPTPPFHQQGVQPNGGYGQIGMPHSRWFYNGNSPSGYSPNRGNISNGGLAPGSYRGRSSGRGVPSASRGAYGGSGHHIQHYGGYVHDHGHFGLYNGNGREF